MIFLSHAATFDFKSAWRHLWARGRSRDRQALIRFLNQHYAGETVLYYNCRSAITAAVQSLVPAGSKIVVNGLTCSAVPQAIRAAKCDTKYLDVDPGTLNFDAKKLEQAVKSDNQIKAVIIQNMLGITVDIASIEKVSRKYGLSIIEDLAHCAGAHYPDGREVGAVGDAVVLSFGKGKVIDTSHGGALVVRDSTTAHQFSAQATQKPSHADNFRDRIYPVLGVISRKLWRSKIGPAIVAASLKLKLITKSADGPILPKTTLANWQAKLALEQLKALPAQAKLRQKCAAATLETLLDVAHPSGILSKGAVPIRLPLLVNKRDTLLKTLQKHGFYLDDVWYDVPVSPRRYYSRAHFPEQDCPEATRIASQLINLPTDIPPESFAGAIGIIQNWIEEHGNV